MERWHLIYTKPRQEEIAFDNLTHQNYKVYLPLLEKEKILRGKKVLIKEPMFPRYIFVRYDNEGHQNWTPIRSTKGVSHPVSFGGSLATLDDKIINNLMQRLDKDPAVR